MVFPGFNKRKRSSIGGDFDGDGVKNRKDCQPLNWRKQDDEDFETIDESRRRIYPGMEKPWSKSEEEEFIKRKKRLKKLLK